jgi:hypothetical protein
LDGIYTGNYRHVVVPHVVPTSNLVGLKISVNSRGVTSPMRKGVLASALVTASLLALGEASWGAERPALVVIPQTAAKDAALFSPTEREIAKSERIRLVLLGALQPLMRQADERSNIRGRTGVVVEEGRKALMALDHDLARQKLSGALSDLERSYMRYYDPRVQAQVRVLLGVISLEIARPDLARQEFVEALQLDPTLNLDAHYSPQVRTAFSEALQNAPPPSAPSTENLHRLVKLATAKGALVLSLERNGEQVLLKGALYLDEKGSYIGVESRLVNTAQSSLTGSEAVALGVQMRRMVDAHFPAPKSSLVVLKKPLVPPPPPPRRRKPWYLKWYTFVAAGGIITAAIALPLALRGRYVEMTLRW